MSTPFDPFAAFMAGVSQGVVVTGHVPGQVYPINQPLPAVQTVQAVSPVRYGSRLEEEILMAAREAEARGHLRVVRRNR
jgi:hypothetical protein